MYVLYKCEYCDFTGGDTEVYHHENRCDKNPHNRACGSCIFRAIITFHNRNKSHYMCKNNPGLIGDEVLFDDMKFHCCNWESNNIIREELWDLI